MAIQFVRDQLIDDIINADKMDFSAGQTFAFDTGATVTVKTPTTSNEATPKSYVDAVLNGLNWKDPVYAASTGNIAGTYNNGTNGVGATLTVSNSGISMDNIDIIQGQRVLLKDQNTPQQNGIYDLSVDGNALGASVSIKVENNNQLTAAIKSNIAIKLTDAGTSNLVNNTSNLVIQDFSGTSHTFTFGDAEGNIDIVTGVGGGEATLDNLASAINAQNPRKFQIGNIGIQRKIYFADAGAPSGTRTISSNAMTAFELGGQTTSPQNIGGGSNGDKITFTLADDSTKVFDFVSATPGSVGQQIAKGSTELSTALSISNTLNSHPDFTARLSFDDPATAVVSLATTGTGGNGKAVSFTFISNTPLSGGSTFNGGKAAGNSVLTRSEDFDKSDEIASAAVFVQKGTNNADNGFTCTSNEPIQIGLNAIRFVQFNGAGQIDAGAGLSKSANTLSVNVDNSSLEIVSDTLRIKAGGNGLTGGGANLLAVQANGSTLDVSSSGVKVASEGITATEINTSALGTGMAGGAGTAITLDLSDFSLATPAASDSFLTLDSDGSTIQRTTTDALATLLAGTGLSASSGVLAVGSLALAQVSFRPYIDTATGDGSTVGFDLTKDVTVNNWLNGVIVSRNGQILKRITSGSAADSSEYTIASSGGTTTVTFGAAPTSGEHLQFNYIADA